MASTRSSSGMLESDDNELENGFDAGCERKRKKKRKKQQQKQEQHFINKDARDAQLSKTDHALAMHGHTNLPAGDPVVAVQKKKMK